MKLRPIVLSTLLLAAIASLAQTPRPEGLVVHEWGTFLAMNGADGVTLDGMYHEEHALPAFVHARSREQLHLPSSSLKGETPVIYFYTGTPMNVSVKVRFPRGVWTQWYPQAEFIGPSLEQSGAPLDPRNGHISWTVNLIPPTGKASTPALPQTDKDALWNYARQV
ncbi:MAG TPA: hypothetical protein VKT32_16145, partial [Chthonomonadaceae bacterium]|nr:hypothetical protein [Chthonomonadaceae bacterium]